MWYLKNYYCPDCDIHWSDVWDCLCDDKCPSCNCSYSTASYEVLEDDGVEPVPVGDTVCGAIKAVVIAAIVVYVAYGISCMFDI
jgi:hypothetical protein